MIRLDDMDNVCSLHCIPNDCKAEFGSGEADTVYTVMVWAFICEWISNSVNWYSLWNSYK